MGSLSIWITVTLALVGGGELVATVPDGFELVEGSLRFSQDGAHVAYVAAKNGKFHPVVGAEVGAAYDEVAPPVLHPSGTPVFFRAMERNQKNEEEWVLLRDGKKIAEGGWIGPVGLGAQGEPAYWVFKDRHQKGGCVLTFGKKKTKKWQTGDLDSRPGISADGKLAVSVATRDDDWVIVSLNDKGVEETHGSGSVISAIPQPDGKAVLATLLTWQGSEPPRGQPRRYHLERLPFGDRLAASPLGQAYRSAGSPCFSADGKHFACKVLDENGKMGVTIDDQGGAPCPYLFVDELAFSADGSSVAFSACLEGKLLFPPTFELESTAGSEVLVGVSATKGKWVAVAGERRSAEYELVRFPTWSPDGNSVAFAGLRDGTWRVIVDERSSEPCAEIACIAWDPSGKRVRYGCREGGELLWRELALE